MLKKLLIQINLSESVHCIHDASRVVERSTTLSLLFEYLFKINTPYLKIYIIGRVSLFCIILGFSGFIYLAQ